jgi:thymidylate synthase ThyX
VQWQRLTPALGAGGLDLLGDAGCGDDMRRAYELSAAEWERLAAEGREREAAYALCLGFRIRYVLDLNAREAMQLIELRSGREGHPSYRAVAHEMHRLIAQVHPAVAGAMRHVDTEAEPRLERILSEMRTQAKRDALTGP